MENKSLAYFDFGELGCYALTPKMRGDYGISPKNMLVRLSPKEIEEHRSELIKGEAICKTLRTGARFCIFETEKPKVYMEAIEMTLQSWRYSVMLKEHREPSLEEARKSYRNAFLVLVIKPRDFGEVEHIE